MIESFGSIQVSKMAAIAVLSTIIVATAAAQDTTDDDTFSHSVTIKREVADVWAALVTKKLVDTYYFAPISGDLTEVGQTFYYGTTEQQLITGKVLELKPPELLKHSFKFGGPGQEDSTVAYSLNSEGKATELTITHEGYGKETQSYADIADGWPIILNGLKAKLEAN